MICTAEKCSECWPPSTTLSIVEHGEFNTQYHSNWTASKLITLLPLSQRKQLQRSARISNLPPSYHASISPEDREILDKSIETLVQDVHKRVLKPIDILRTYGKVAIRAHNKTNCLTEIMLPEAEAWADNEINLEGPLAGIPVSLKDSITVRGFDVSVGYSCNTGKPYAEDGNLVKILKAAGQYSIPFVNGPA